MIRVVMVGDEPMVCAHLRTILGSAGTVEVVDEAHDGAAGVEAALRSAAGFLVKSTPPEDLIGHVSQ